MDNDQRECIGNKSEQDKDESVPSVTGLNDNLAVFGKQLHVQTELLRCPGFCISTQVFSKGRVLLSRKSECAPELINPRETNKIQDLIFHQHREVVREIQMKSAEISVPDDSH
jgi:hypothetical protein